MSNKRSVNDVLILTIVATRSFGVGNVDKTFDCRRRNICWRCLRSSKGGSHDSRR
mgnify:CR=1 FL=1